MPLALLGPQPQPVSGDRNFVRTVPRSPGPLQAASIRQMLSSFRYLFIAHALPDHAGDCGSNTFPSRISSGAQ